MQQSLEATLIQAAKSAGIDFMPAGNKNGIIVNKMGDFFAIVAEAVDLFHEEAEEEQVEGFVEEVKNLCCEKDVGGSYVIY